jgi:DNA polymerase-3 subunit alpha (Gram-positive type)
MKEHDVPDWYIKSCEKIKYMFPKAHAAAYVTMAFRIAWFKVHMPKAYYAAYFSIRAKQFDSDAMMHGVENVKNKMKAIDLEGNAAANKDKEMYPVLELVLEMNLRGIDFLPVDLYKSHYEKFLVEPDGLRPPLSAINGLGPIDAENIYNAAKDGVFMSISDMQIRSKVGKVAIETLRGAGCLDGMSESNQMSLF